MQRVNRIVSHLSGEAATSSLTADPCAITSHIEAAPADAILGINQAFKKDTDPRKVNVCVGAYRTDEGKPYVLKCVREAEKIIFEDKSLNIEYLPQRGDQEFAALSRKVLMGENAKPILENRVATVQSLSGTGALRIGGVFTAKFFAGKTVYCSVPTWGTHNSIMAHSGVKTGKYRYWDAKTKGLDFAGMIADIEGAPNGSIFLLHACAHNPTGVDPTKEQWAKISDVMKAKGHIAWFDSAYQGFASGNLNEDAFAVQHFIAQGHDIWASVSYAKNFGLYGQRIGTFSVVCADEANAAAVLTQLDILIRNLYSNPPLHGMRIVKTVLSNPKLIALWQEDMTYMSNRINEMRGALRSELEKIGAPGDWSHITSQIGMFSFTGLTPEQSTAMLEKHHIYMLKNGRISMAGINSKNVKYVAECIKAVLS
jgi:aspartate/tyrosine/aromatic aminotransferase